MFPTFFKFLKLTPTTGKFTCMKLVLDILGESIWSFVLESAQALLWIVPVVFQMFLGLLSYPIMALAWWIGFLWLLFVHPNSSSALYNRKQGRLGKQHIKPVPRYIRQNLLSKNKAPIYAYAAQLNIFISYRLTGLHASFIGGKIFENNGMDSLGVMA